MENRNSSELPLFRDNYRPEITHYPVQLPAIKSGAEYYFTTESGLNYQVIFARKKDNYLEHIINFSVLSDEFEDEYSETNRGEIYRVIATVIEIIRIFHQHHLSSTSYEFSGEFKQGNEAREISIRTQLYYRKARGILHPGWELETQKNKVVVRCNKGKRPVSLEL
jgi:hypothetical protein